MAVVPAAGGAPVSVTDTLDEDAQLAGWTPTGLYVTALAEDGVAPVPRRPARTARSTRVSTPDALAMQGASFSADGITRGLRGGLGDDAARGATQPTSPGFDAEGPDDALDADLRAGRWARARW